VAIHISARVEEDPREVERLQYIYEQLQRIALDSADSHALIQELPSRYRT